MATARRQRTEDSATRTALMEAAEQLMLEEGYAAVTSRRVAAGAGVNAGLVYYYFGTMDELFIAVFRRRAEWMLQRQAEALRSEHPLRALWEVTRNEAATVLNLEFLALGNHRKAIRTEIQAYSRRFRADQLSALATALDDSGIDPEAWPPGFVALVIDGMARFLRIEEVYDLDIGHHETLATFERLLCAVEGKH
jgi:AcrR family transcriptional regulator